MRLLYAADHPSDAYLARALKEAGHVVDAAGEPDDALAMAGEGEYEAIVLDLVGASSPWIARFSAASPASLILLIADRADHAGRSAALKAGADACFTRPAAFIELEARLAALARLVRRNQAPRQGGGVTMIPAEQAMSLGGARIALSSREYRLMALLSAHSGEVIGLERLLREGWGDAAEPRPDLVRACLARIRRKLERSGAGASLRPISGHGYVFQAPAPSSPKGQD